MPISGNGSHSKVITIGVFAALSYDITSANLSSPQTFELNVNQREGTLRKWLNMNVIEALVWGAGASWLDKTPYPFYGSLLGIASMFVKYHYAVASGKRKKQPDMETASGEYATGGGEYLWHRPLEVCGHLETSRSVRPQTYGEPGSIPFTTYAGKVRRSVSADGRG